MTLRERIRTWLWFTLFRGRRRTGQLEPSVLPIPLPPPTGVYAVDAVTRTNTILQNYRVLGFDARPLGHRAVWFPMDEAERVLEAVAMSDYPSGDGE